MKSKYRVKNKDILIIKVRLIPVPVDLLVHDHLHKLLNVVPVFDPLNIKFSATLIRLH
jgi:hypothetical protein